MVSLCNCPREKTLCSSDYPVYDLLSVSPVYLFVLFVTLYSHATGASHIRVLYTNMIFFIPKPPENISKHVIKALYTKPRGVLCTANDPSVQVELHDNRFTVGKSTSSFSINQFVLL